jgi:hypothetical protein
MNFTSLEYKVSPKKTERDDLAVQPLCSADSLELGNTCTASGLQGHVPLNSCLIRLETPQRIPSNSALT